MVKTMINPNSKVNQFSGNKSFIVFDMDECLISIHGYAFLLEILYNAKNHLISQESYNDYYNFMFNDLLNNWSNYKFLRPDLITILTLIYFLKLILNKQGKSLECIIYTNNGLEPLVIMVQQILNSLTGFPIIDGYVYRNSNCKIDIGPIGRMTKRLEHLQRCYSSEINSNNTLFFDNDNYTFFKSELGKNYIQVNRYYFYNNITLYNFYNNHIRFILVNRNYLGIFPIVSRFNDNLEVYIQDLVRHINSYENDSFSLIIPSIFNFLGVLPNGNEFLLNFLAKNYIRK